MRWGQINIREVEPPEFDVAWWEDYWKSIHLDGITLNAGGLVAYYPTKLPDHHRSRWLGDRDLFGELVAAVKRCHMRVLARIDPGESYEDVYWRHLDWFAFERDGRPMREQSMPELYVPCMNGPYYWEFVPQIMREILDTYDVDGIFCSEWDGRRRICYCPRCRGLFPQATGHQLPTGADPNDMAWKQWVIWHERRLEDLWRFWDGLVKEHKPGTFWMGNHSDRGFLADLAEMINVDNQSRRGDHPLWAVGEQGKKMRALTRGQKPYFHIFSSNSYSRHVAKPEAEYRLYIADAVLADSRPWFTIIGGVQQDKRQFGPLADMYRWHHAHEDELRDRRSLAQVAIVFHDRQRFLPRTPRGNDAVHSASSAVPGLGTATQAHLPGPRTTGGPGNPGGDSFRGMYYALLRNRVPFDLAHVARLDENSLAPYKLLVLPHVAALSDEEAENVRRFVRRGGALLATFETGAYDEWGRPRAKGALDDLLGVAQRWPTTGPVTHAYAQLHHDRDRHCLLTGLEGTEVTLGTDYLVPVQAAPGTHGAALTLIPPYISYPPEEAFSRTGDSGLPLALLTEGKAGEGRRVFWPGNVAAFFMATNSPDYSRLLRNSVEWAFPGEQPAQVTGPGLIEMHPYRREGSLQVHLVNFTNPDAWRAPVHELLPVGEQLVRIRVPAGQSAASYARCLVSGRTLPVSESDGWAETTLPNLLDHEIVVFDLA
jgi:Hypothetical glycosyl hydrolase 6/Beta-galactosidase trimerisation domain